MKKYFAIGGVALVAAVLAVRAQDADVAKTIQAAQDAVRHGQYTDADVLYAKVAAGADSDQIAPALWYLGTRAAGQANKLAAVGFFERLLRVDPKGPNTARALTWLGNLKSDDPANAEALFKQALALEQPGTSDAQETSRSYAFLLRRTGRAEEAQAMVEQWSHGVQAASTGAKANALPAGVYRVGDGVAAPKLLHKIEPQYTDQARDTKIQGPVALSVDIGPDGFATNIEVQRSLEPGLDTKAIEAVRQWQFQPGTKNGVPVTVRAVIEVNFRLQ
jgi:TonB family protein